MRKKIRNCFAILLSSVVIGSILLMLIYSLPVDSARAHVEESLYEMLEIKDDEANTSLRKKIVNLKENFTDTLMVQNALEKVEGKSALEHAMYVYHYDLSTETTWLTEESLVAFLKNGSDGMALREYSRYWHGYLVFLKPLLMLMPWKYVEIFLVVVQAVLLIAILVLAFRKKQMMLGVGVVSAFLFIKPIGVWFSLAMYVCWFIVMVSFLVLLLFYEKIQLKNLQWEVFLLIGIVTAYMDFLTYPIVTLGLPLCFYLVQDVGKHAVWWKRIKQTIGLCVCWAIGYIGMWGMKWVVAEATCQTGSLRSAVWSVIYRTGPLDGYGSFFTGVSRTIRAVLEQYDSIFYTLIFVVIAASALVSVLLCLIKAADTDWGITIICLTVIALFPFVWMVLVQNHTAIHCHFTFRIMSVSIMALWCMMICSVRTLRVKAGKMQTALGKNKAENGKRMGKAI